MAEAMDLAVSALEGAQKAGAEGVWVTYREGRSAETVVREGVVEKLQKNASRSLTIELWDKRRYASHRTTDLRPASLREFVGEALALTRALEPESDRLMPDPSLFQGRASVDLQLVDPSVDGLDPARRQALCMAMDAPAHQHERVLSVSSQLNDAWGRGVAVSSNGFSGSWSGTSVSLSCDVTVRDQGDRRPEGSSWATVRALGELPDPAHVGADALEKALSRLGSRKGEGGPVSLVVDSRAAGRLITALLQGAEARAFHQGRSVWKANEKKVLFPLWFRLVDDPLRLRGLGSRLFDGEGIAARPLPLIADGALQNLYIDTFYGRKIGRPPTTGEASNRVVTPGSRPLTSLLEGSGIYVTSWLGGNSDATTGKFSFGLRGHRFENGRIGEPVGEMNATGNLLELFGYLVEVGNDPWPYSSVVSPSLRFEGVQLS